MSDERSESVAKVTECWVSRGEDNRPTTQEPYNYNDPKHPAILMWREDYEQLVKERNEYQKRCRYNLDPGAQITCWDEYESLRVRLLECEGERSSWKAECKSRGEEVEELRKELEQRDAELEELRAWKEEMCA